MNKHFLKQIRDNMPESLKRLMAPVFRNKLIKNKFYVQYRNLLQKRDYLNNDVVIAYQFQQLKAICNYANKHIPYYKTLFEKVGFVPNQMTCLEDIKVVPFLTKELIREHFEDLISIKKVPGGHYVATTGGSTGEPLKVLLDYDCVFKENAFVNHFRRSIGYEETHKLATFRGIEFGDELWKFNPMQNELIFSPFKLSKNTLHLYVNRINKYKPDYLNGYLSSLTLFAKLMSESNLKLKHKIKGVLLISENIDIAQRDFLENYFKVKSLTFYGHSERCIIAEEILPNEYAFDPYYGYTETVENGDGSSFMVGTGFLNKTMPLIRYKTDDRVIQYDKLYRIDGSRKSTMGLFGINGEFFSQAAFNIHNEILNNVNQYQFFQNQMGKADFLLVVNENFCDTEIDQIKREVDKKTKDVIDFNIKIVDQVILSKRGKFSMFINELNQNNA
jgi:phenylacetate-CoA ligase